jgi:DNA-binding transcriptional ArsR family regulator
MPDMSPEAQAPLAVVGNREGVAALLPPLRREILGRLRGGPDSAAGLARRLGLARQKVNYHVRALERAGFLELSGQRKCRGCTERRFRPTARAYLITPEVLGEPGTDAAGLGDRFSSAYLLTLAARVVQDVARLRPGADRAGKTLATFALHVDVRFRSPAERAAFAEELAGTIARLAARYHVDSPEGRAYRFVVAGHPVVKKPGTRKGEKTDDQEQG